VGEFRETRMGKTLRGGKRLRRNWETEMGMQKLS